tara:strand:- start:920 stop:1078 length:159 start_codon:yes stop_codon:yes gene_type:complete
MGESSMLWMVYFQGKVVLMLFGVTSQAIFLMLVGIRFIQQTWSRQIFYSNAV